MSEIVINMSGLGQYTMGLDLIDPSEPNDINATEVWRATFCDAQTNDCEIVYFEMGIDYEVWDLVNLAIETFRQETLPD